MVLGLLSKVLSKERPPAPKKESSYLREFIRELDAYVDDMRRYLRALNVNITDAPKLFETLVVDGAKLDPQLFEGLAPIGKAPWYFIGSPDFIHSVEAKLQQNADKVNVPVKYGRGQLTCMRLQSGRYESCSIADYVKTDRPGNEFRLSALPPASAYRFYQPNSEAKLDIMLKAA